MYLAQILTWWKNGIEPTVDLALETIWRKKPFGAKIYSDENINFPLNSNCVRGQFDKIYDLLQRSIRRKTLYDERVEQVNDTRWREWAFDTQISWEEIFVSRLRWIDVTDHLALIRILCKCLYCAKLNAVLSSKLRKVWFWAWFVSLRNSIWHKNRLGAYHIRAHHFLFLIRIVFQLGLPKRKKNNMFDDFNWCSYGFVSRY